MTKHASLESMARHLVSMEKRLGVPADRQLILPEDRAKPGAMDEVYRALGRPDTAEGYAVKVADGAPDYVGAFATDLAKDLHGLGASKAVVDKVIELTNATWQKQLDGHNAQVAADQAKIDAEIKAQWGDQAEPMRKAVSKLLQDEAMLGQTPEAGKQRWEAVQAELEAGLGKSPVLFGMLARIVQGRMEGGQMPVADMQGGLQGALSLDMARAAKNAFQSDPAKMEAWRDAKHPGHKSAVDEMRRINTAIVGAGKSKK